MLSNFLPENHTKISPESWRFRWHIFNHHCHTYHTWLMIPIGPIPSEKKKMLVGLLFATGFNCTFTTLDLSLSPASSGEFTNVMVNVIGFIDSLSHMILFFPSYVQIFHDFPQCSMIFPWFSMIFAWFSHDFPSSSSFIAPPDAFWSGSQREPDQRASLWTPCAIAPDARLGFDHGDCDVVQNKWNQWKQWKSMVLHKKCIEMLYVEVPR